MKLQDLWKACKWLRKIYIGIKYIIYRGKKDKIFGQFVIGQSSGNFIYLFWNLWHNIGKSDLHWTTYLKFSNLLEIFVTSRVTSSFKYLETKSSF